MVWAQGMTVIPGDVCTQRPCKQTDVAWLIRISILDTCTVLGGAMMWFNDDEMLSSDGRFDTLGKPRWETSHFRTSQLQS